MLGNQVCIVCVWRVSSTACRGIDDSMEAMGTAGFAVLPTNRAVSGSTNAAKS